MRTIADTYIEQGILQGIEKGIYQRNIEIATRMLKENADINFIASVTDLSVSDIAKLKS